ncbi:reverse transcriptase domain-containing protein [Tanacetum coccineum]
MFCDRAFKRVNTFEDFRTELVEGKEKRAGKKLIQDNAEKQKVEDDKETTELKQCLEIIPDEEEVTIDAIPLAVKSPNLEDLYKLVKAKYESTRPVEDLDLLLWGDLKTMFTPHVEDNIYMLVEKKYPLAPLTLSMMLEKKLIIDYETGVSTAQRLQRKYAKCLLLLVHNCSAEVNAASENMLEVTTASEYQNPEGYEDAIVIPEINANFELKHGLINLVQNKQFFGHDKEDPHAHIRYFNKITSTMRFPDVPSTSIKLMLFPFSLEGSARIWLEKEPPRSILTWDDLVSKFINQFFPPSKTTNLQNEITRFQQRFDESFYEAWDRFNDLLRACPHHGFSELHQLDTFYNALNARSDY